jgi:hypothetical protein
MPSSDVATHPAYPPRSNRHPTFAEQVVPTIDFLRRAIRAGDRAGSVKWIDYLDFEWVGSNFGFYTQWHAEGIQFLRDNGVTEGDIEGMRGDLALLVNTGFRPDVPYDREAELARYRILKARLLRELGAPVDVALATLAEWKEQWRAIHDRDVDYASGIMNVALLRFGEEKLEALLRSAITDRFDSRYARYDVSRFDWKDAFADLVHASVETQRGHLVGPEREGTVELAEHDDRVVISFEPCGTGGRTVAGDKLSRTPSRHEAPYWFATIDRKHDFSWNKEGVCQYCSHCAMMTGKLPIERFGYPLRVVEPPLKGDPGGRCTWTIYKDVRDYPAWYYESLGETKPAADAPLGSGRHAAAGSAGVSSAPGRGSASAKP